ncbi:OmpH family outer membrane protein [Salegentibacter chungangensis]|uniref:OmpH family outer membrane protein n=1 Tax=Salegentibacter chungangensis TaxID=1335724 RepID=A0ABW3NVL0_9FLAO
MKKLSLVLALLCFSLMTTAQTKVGTIDADYILSQMPEISEVNKGIEEYNANLKSDMEATIKKYDSLVQNYQEKSTEFTDEERKKEESEIIALENEIKNFRQRASVMIQMRRNKLSQPLYEKIDKAMLEVIKEEGFTQILHAGGNALAFADQRFDITEKVMKKLGIEIPEQPKPEASEN